MREEPAQRGAALAGGAGGGEQDAAGGEIEIGGRRHDHAVVAAEFEDGAAEALGDARRHGAAHARRSGGAHQPHALIVDQRLAGRDLADDDGR
jgi:hypothetical protein